MADDPFIAKMKAEIKYLRSKLEPLESRVIRIFERGEHGEVTTDITQDQIASIKRMIANLQSVIDRG